MAPAGTGSYRTFETRHVPHLIWEEDFERDFRPLLEGSNIGDTAARVAISLALMRLTGKHRGLASIGLLGLEGCVICCLLWNAWFPCPVPDCSVQVVLQGVVLFDGGLMILAVSGLRSIIWIMLLRCEV